MNQLDSTISKLGLQSIPWACEHGKHTAVMKTREAVALCNELESLRIEAYAMADFDDASLSWVTVFTDCA